MRLVKIFLVAGLFLALLAAGVWQFWLKEQRAFAQIATAYAAKQICSCRFVADRPMDSCLQDFTEDISALTIVETEQHISARAPLGLSSDQARFETHLGCVLEPS